VNDNASGFTTEGERRFTDIVVSGGRGNSSDRTGAQLDFNTPAEEEIVLAARAPSGSASVDASLRWEEFF